jgi:hypothetical protein
VAKDHGTVGLVDFLTPEELCPQQKEEVIYDLDVRSKSGINQLW